MNVHLENAIFETHFNVDQTRVYFAYTGLDSGHAYFNRHNGSKNERLTLLWEGWAARRSVQAQIQQALDHGDLT